MTDQQAPSVDGRAEQDEGYDDWVERLDPHARSKFEQMFERNTYLTDSWREQRDRADAACTELEETRNLTTTLGRERDAAREALEDAVHHLGQHHGCLHVTENPAMQAFYARAYGGDLSEAFKTFKTMGRQRPQEIAASEVRELVQAEQERADTAEAWAARWKAAATRYRRMLAVHRDREPISHAEFSRFVEEAREQRERADRLAVAYAQIRSVLIRQGELERAWRCLLCFEEWQSGETERHAPKGCALALPPDQRGREILEAGKALRKYGERVVRGEGTLQRYEYLADALDAWDRYRGGPAGDGLDGA